MKDSDRRLAVLGGSFDPPHNGHAEVLELLFASGLTDGVLLVPSGERADKNYVATPEQRLSMLQGLCCERFAQQFEDGRLMIERCQLTHGLPVGSWTVDLIRYLKIKFLEVDLFFVVGADLISHVPTWRNGAWLVENQKFIVIGRHGLPQPVSTPLQIKWLAHTTSTNQISSSAVRLAIARGQDISALVPSSVADIIRHAGLYC